MFVSAESSAPCSVDQLLVGGDEFTLIGAARGHGEFDAPHAGAHQRADFEELEADRAAGGSGELDVVEGMRRSAQSST